VAARSTGSTMEIYSPRSYSQMLMSWASSPGIRRSMQSNRPRNTLPEITLRSALHRSGLRFRKHVRPLPGLRCEVDIAFPKQKLAVFVDGCWWHSCPQHGMIPKTNVDFWTQKLQRTQERDLKNTLALEDSGWSVLRVWEHLGPEDAVNEIISRLTMLASSGT
jgi:DNA mismatch endonuclease, patch repair protein